MKYSEIKKSKFNQLEVNKRGIFKLIRKENCMMPELVTNGALIFLSPEDATHVLDMPKHTHTCVALRNISFSKWFCILNWLSVFHCTRLTEHSPESHNLNLLPVALLCLTYSEVYSQTRTQEICWFHARGNLSKSRFWTWRTKKKNTEEWHYLTGCYTSAIKTNYFLLQKSLYQWSINTSARFHRRDLLYFTVACTLSWKTSVYSCTLPVC